MTKKYWVVGSLVGLLMVVGAGCTGASNDNQAGDNKETSKEQSGSKLINPKGDINVPVSASDKQDMVADAKNITTSVFGGASKLQGLMDTDIVAKGSFGIAYSTPEPTVASQLDALVSAFRSAGYSIIEKHAPVATGEDKTGGVIAEKRSKVFVFVFEPGQKEVSFSGMSKDQYTYLMNTDDNGDPIK